jgi:hypothetical protein
MTRKSKPPRPRCAGVLKDGSACRSVAVVGDYCAFHAQVIAATFPPAPEAESEAMASDSGHGEAARVPSGSVRADLRGLAEASSEVIQAFFDSALRADKTAFGHCPSCQKRVPVQVPDWPARLKAIETLLEQGFGRPPVAGADSGMRSVYREELDKMSDVELDALVAAGEAEERKLATLSEAGWDVELVYRAARDGREMWSASPEDLLAAVNGEAAAGAAA